MAYQKSSMEGEMGSGDSDDEFYNVKLSTTPVVLETKKTEVKKVYSPPRTKVNYDYKFDSSSDDESDSPKIKRQSPPREPDANVFTPVPKNPDKIPESTLKVVEKINDELKSSGRNPEKIDKTPPILPSVPIIGPANQPVMPIGPQGMMMGMANQMMMNMMAGPAMPMQGNLMGMNMMPGVMMGMIPPQANMIMNPNMMGMVPGNMINMIPNQSMLNISNPNPGLVTASANPVANPAGLGFNPGNQSRLRTPNPGIRVPPVNFRPRLNNFKWQNSGKAPPLRPGFPAGRSDSAGYERKELRYDRSESDERGDSDAESSGRSSPSSDNGGKALSPFETPNSFKNDGSFMEMFKKMSGKEEKEDKSKSAAETSEGSSVKKPSALTPSLFGKRRGGRVLKTGMVKKVKKVEDSEEDKGPKDAWSMYMAEVKKYREASCEEEGKTRPLVK